MIAFVLSSFESLVKFAIAGDDDALFEKWKK